MEKTIPEQIKQALRDNMIFGDNAANEAIAFVAELIDISIQDTKEREPYATNSIAAMERAYSIVRDLDEFLEANK